MRKVGLVDAGTRSSGRAIGSVPRYKAPLVLSKRKIVERLGLFWDLTQQQRGGVGGVLHQQRGGVWVKERLPRSCPPARAHAVNIRGLQCTRAKANALVVSQVCFWVWVEAHRPSGEATTYEAWLLDECVELGH